MTLDWIEVALDQNFEPLVNEVTKVCFFVTELFRQIEDFLTFLTTKPMYKHFGDDLLRLTEDMDYFKFLTWRPLTELIDQLRIEPLAVLINLDP